MKHLSFCSNPDDQMERKMTSPQVEITCIEFGFVSNRMPPSCTMNTGCGEFRWKFISNWNAFSSLYFPGAGRSNFKFDSCISIPNSLCCQFKCVSIRKNVSEKTFNFSASLTAPSPFLQEWPAMERRREQWRSLERVSSPPFPRLSPPLLILYRNFSNCGKCNSLKLCNSMYN